jgi:hypothetical protein
MKTIDLYLTAKQEKFSQHPFFQLLTANQLPLKNFLTVVGQLGFWIMTFQDVLRLNEALVKDPYLRKIAKHHRIEDSGHDKWFLEDIANITGTDVLNITNFFDKSTTATRDAAYAVISEVTTAVDEYHRIILLQTLESSIR